MTTSTDQHGHTHRLDLADSTVREWDATVLSADPEQGIVLDRSAFYPGGGGQPPDEGVLLWGGVRTRIAGTRKGDELEVAERRRVVGHVGDRHAVVRDGRRLSVEHKPQVRQWV